MSSIAYAAEEAKLGGREAARSMGELAENLAIASGNAQFAGWAIDNPLLTAAKDFSDSFGFSSAAEAARQDPRSTQGSHHG
jgi:hypothetical protein